MTFILWSFKIIMTPWLTTFSLESLVQCHYPHPGLIAARPESRNRLNKICLRKWSRLNDFKRQKHHARLLHQRQLIQEVKKQNKTHKHFINCRPHLPSFRVCESVIRKRLGKKQHTWKKGTPDEKTNKGSSHVWQKTSWWSIWENNIIS